MRLNQYVAHASGLSRRAADVAITEGRVHLNGAAANLGTVVAPNDRIELDGQPLSLPAYRTVVLHKPVSYVTSRRQQGTAPTIYKLLPPELQDLKPVGRLDKESSGLLVLTSDGNLAQELQHPSAGKWKLYQVRLDRPLKPADRERLQKGIKLEDGLSQLHLSGSGRSLTVRLQEGRNRQIRRSFAAVGYQVISLHRTAFGSLTLGSLRPGRWRELPARELA